MKMIPVILTVPLLLLGRSRAHQKLLTLLRLGECPGCLAGTFAQANHVRGYTDPDTADLFED